MADESPSLPPGIRLVPVDFDPFAGETPSFLPLTEAQREIWVSIQAGGADASSAYNLCYAMQLRGRLDVNLLRRAFRALVARHEAFRLSFRPDSPEQRIEVGPIEPEVRYVDLSGLAAGEREAQTAALVLAESRTPFDLGSAPPLRACVAGLEPDLHLLTVTVHHIVCDGWSAGALLGDLVALYEGQVRGCSPKLAATQSFGDYVRWQQGSEWQGIHAASEAYWLETLREPPTLDLPTDRPRPRLRTHRGAQERLEIDAGMVRQLRRVGGRYGCTPYILFLAAYQLLLHRLSGQDDIVVGTAVAGQTVKGWENMVGHAVSVLPQRSRLDLDAPFSRYLAETKQTVLDAQEHQAVTFGTLVPKIKLSRDPSRIPLVPAVFNLDRVFGALRFADLAVQSLPMPKSFVTFELGLNVVDYGSGVIVEADYNTDLFDGVTIRRWLGHLHTILRAIAEAPEQPVSTLPLLTDPERAQLVVDWNGTAVEYPEALGLHELVDAQAERTPEAVALVCGETRLTYGQVQQRANQLARHLRARGVGPEVLVGICAERSVEMVVGVLGILKAGGAYVPLDPEHPEERLRFVLEDTGAPLVVTQDAVRGRLPRSAVGVVSLDGDWPAIAGESPEAPATSVRPEQLAYVIYTSGSTGKPKGVAIPHRAVVNFLLSMQKEPAVTTADVLVAVTTLSFDIAVLELLLPLTVGARVVVASRESAMDGRALATLLAQSGATVMQATPATWRMLIESGWVGTPTFKVLCGGEALSRDLAAALLERAGEVWNLYGPTETTIWSTRCRVAASEGPVTIGRPLANTQTYVLDAHGQPAPIGVAGELCIGGDGVARGYLNRPELTSERFVPDPFRHVPGARLYRTGDLARYRANGDLECLGRLDHQVKIRGFRIELGEIEAVLGQQPGVSEAVVVAREDVPGDKRLVAYVVGRDAEITVSDLRQHMRARLPEYMVPTAWAMLDSLPLTSNGKVDRKALPVPEGDACSSALHAAPSTDTEAWVAALWAEILHVERVGREDDFFVLGGHSLLATVVATRVRASFGVSLSVRDIFEASTVAQVAECIDTLRWTVNGRSGELSATKTGREEMVL